MHACISTSQNNSPLTRLSRRWKQQPVLKAAASLGEPGACCWGNFYFAYGRGTKYCDQRICVSVSLLVCLSACVTRIPHVQITANIFCGCDSVLLWRRCDSLYIPVLWMTSRFHEMQRIGQNRRRRVCIVQFASWRHQGEVCRLRLHFVSNVVWNANAPWFF